jgi:hypothetical protein
MDSNVNDQIERLKQRERVPIRIFKSGEGRTHEEWLKQNNLLMSEKQVEDFLATHKFIGETSLLD